MQLRVRRAAHFLERSGLAMAGAACGLFVGAHVGSSIGALTTVAFLLAMMAVGAIGFYLGIDIPPLPFHAGESEAQHAQRGKIDAAEFLSAVGTFCATLAAFASVALVVLHLAPHLAWTGMILAAWLGGVAMQIVAGAIGRARR
ncbi:MAG: hypothetical protein HZA66_09495 [Rhodopseudomonas palustris]|uniref:Uncharacterized protein n=1 Tax=Rhodopseudomonas palustris TaxID=1076 RepID=A0A933S065_RHOPL|nr:hypothetical protein [Rhodopseudomonas palustris]